MTEFSEETTVTTNADATNHHRINSLKKILTCQYGLVTKTATSTTTSSSQDDSLSSSSSSLVHAIAAGLGEATVKISSLLANHRGQEYVGTQNASGDSQLDVDVETDKAVFDALKSSGVFSHAISEETPVETYLLFDSTTTNHEVVDPSTTSTSSSSFIITFDPLDGSSIIDANFTVGSIFGLWPHKKKTDNNDDNSVILGRTGRDQCASAIALYGPRTILCIALPSSSTNLNRDIVFEVTLVEDTMILKEGMTSSNNTIWVVTKPDIRILPTIGNIFAPGNLRAMNDHPAYASMIQYWMTYGYTLRYSGGMVPDVYHIFTKGKGVFSNISSPKHKAKIRVIYEAAPIALLVECAGGMSLADNEHWTSVLDCIITHLDQRIGLCLGSTEEVELFCKFMSEGTTVAHMAAAEGNIDILQDVLEQSESMARTKDENGWTALHEAVRGGYVDAVQVLLDFGANINERTSHGEGESSLRLSIEEHGYDHPMTDYLIRQGAVDIGPSE